MSAVFFSFAIKPTFTTKQLSYKKFTWLLACVLAITSCEFEEVDMGLPASITLPKEGGEYVLPSDYYILKAWITELSGKQEG